MLTVEADNCLVPLGNKPFSESIQIQMQNLYCINADNIPDTILHH